MIENIFERFYRYLINVDGRLVKDYSLRAFSSELNELFFLAHDVNENKFLTTPYSILWTMLRDYYSTYGTPPSDTTLSMEIQSSPRLSTFQKQDLENLLGSIRQYDVDAGQFDFLRSKIRQNFLRERQLSICAQGIKIGKDDPIKAAEFIQDELAKVVSKATISEDPAEQSKFLWQFMELQLNKFREGGNLMGDIVPYGFKDWDEHLGGMQKGELIIVCGPPGTGKSFLVNQIGYAAALEKNLKVVIANREMLDHQVANRFIARQTKIPSKKLRFTEALTDEERQLVEASMEEFVALKNRNLFFIPPAKCVNASMIKREIELAFGSEKPDLIIVDYLNDLEAEGYQLEGHEKIGKITQALKNLAVYFQCPVISPTQPSSAGLATQNPTMNDVGYKVINQKADTIFFCTEDPENKYVAPMLETGVGTPGIILVKVIKARNDGRPPYPFKLSVEFATTSVCSAVGEYGFDPIAKTLVDD